MKSILEEIQEKLVGKIVLVRSRDAGVHIGRLVALGFEGGVSLALLTESRILWNWKPGDESHKSFTTHGIAIYGVPADSNLSPVAQQPELVEYSCSIIPLTEQAIKTLSRH